MKTRIIITTCLILTFLSACSQASVSPLPATSTLVPTNTPPSTATPTKPPTVTSTPTIEPPSLTVEDIFGRPLKNAGVLLVDWEGYLANPAIKLVVRPPADAAFPSTAHITANGVRLYFDLPCTVSANGPAKTVTFATATAAVPIYLSIFPDRDTLDENYLLTVKFTDATAATRSTTINIHVIDQDKDQSAPFRVTVDFSKDQTGFFNDSAKRIIVQQAADDWAYFFDDMHLDTVPAGTETSWIWNAGGPESGGAYTTNSNSYTGYLLYVYGWHHALLTAGGGSSPYAGGFQSSNGVHQQFPLKRSGDVGVEIQGNYNTLGWFLTISDDDWWQSRNHGNEPHDLYSIVHHEMGHAFMFNGDAYPRFAQAKADGQLQDAAIQAYQRAYPAIDADDHFNGTVDRLSKIGVFGNEYYGDMPRRRWLITKFDLLAAQAVGYRLRQTSPLVPFSVTTTGLQVGQLSVAYSESVRVQGGVPFYCWTIESGTLPNGLTLNSFTGSIAGTPSVVGTFSFVVRARDYDSSSSGIAVPLSITIAN